METFKLKIEILSPVHIGEARGMLSALEFFQDENTVYLVNEGAMARCLAEQKAVDTFTRYVEMDSNPSLDRYFQLIKQAEASKLRREALFRRIAKGEKLRVINFYPCVLDPGSRLPYIPGSSIKGAIRGGILFKLAEGYGGTESIKARSLKKRRNNAGAEFDKLVRAGVKVKERVFSGPQTDWLRFLQVTDVFPVTGDCTEAREVRIVSLNEEEGYHYGARGTRMFVEVFKPGTVLWGRIKHDTDSWSILERVATQKPPLELQKWVEVSRVRCQQVLEAEKEFFRQAGMYNIVENLEFIASRGANLRLGWGAGLLATSLILLFSPEERRRVREAYFSKRRHPVFPQSRKVVMRNVMPEACLGWVRVELN